MTALFISSRLPKFFLRIVIDRRPRFRKKEKNTCFRNAAGNALTPSAEAYYSFRFCIRRVDTRVPSPRAFAYITEQRAGMTPAHDARLFAFFLRRSRGHRRHTAHQVRTSLESTFAVFAWLRNKLQISGKILIRFTAPCFFFLFFLLLFSTSSAPTLQARDTELQSIPPPPPIPPLSLPLSRSRARVRVPNSLTRATTATPSSPLSRRIFSTPMERRSPPTPRMSLSTMIGRPSR